MDTIRVYDNGEDWVEYVEYDCKIFASAHSDSGKYSSRMWRELIKILDIDGVIHTQLRFDYLVKFFSRHYIVEQIDGDYYTVRKVG